MLYLYYMLYTNVIRSQRLRFSMFQLLAYLIN